MSMRKILPFALGGALLVGIGAGIGLVIGSEDDDDRPAVTVFKEVPTPQDGGSTTEDESNGDLTSDEPARLYEEQVEQVDSDLDAISRRVPRASQFGTARFSRAALSMAREVGEIVKNVDLLQPPSVVVSEHEDLTGKLRGVERAFRTLASANRRNDLDAVIKTLARARSRLGDVRDATREVLQELEQTP